ncbi:MAG: hypothetical protein JWN78_2170 [Bacteroidota bacterium]|nr:hypothetical protein [Bacteroidota bacterium]
MKRIIFLSMIMMMCFAAFAQVKTKTKTKTKTKYSSHKHVVKKAAVAANSIKLPHDLFKKLIDSTDAFVINHATEFQHVDLPKKNYDLFNSYIRDSAAVEIPGLKSLIYYNYTLKDGRVIIGDIFWNDRNSYIVFKIYDKKYVNYYSRQGVDQLRSIFKL